LYDLIGSYFIVLDKENIVFFDGSCGLCQGSVKWLLTHERPTAQAEKPVYFASLASSWAAHLPANLPDSIVYLEGNRVFTKSTAVFRLCTRLKWPWRFLYYFRFVPLFIADAVYDQIAIWRKKTRVDTELCETIKPEWRSRLLM